MPGKWSIETPWQRHVADVSRSVWSRIKAEWRAKLLLLVVLWLAFGVPYLMVQRFPIRTPIRFAWTPLDTWIGFHPAWVFVYQSAYLLIPIAPFLAVRRADLWIYTRGFLLMTALAIGIFLLFPVEGPRPAQVPTDGVFGMLMTYDRPLNAFPSLHVGLVVHSLAFGWALTRASRFGVFAQAALGLGLAWAVLIAYSTLATKQHYLIDLPAGAILGWGSQWWSSRLARVVPVVASGTF